MEGTIYQLDEDNERSRVGDLINLEIREWRSRAGLASRASGCGGSGLLQLAGEAVAGHRHRHLHRVGMEWPLRRSGGRPVLPGIVIVLLASFCCLASSRGTRAMTLACQGTLGQ